MITEIYELLSDVEIKLLKGMLQSGICLWDKAVSDNSEQPNCVHESSAINENCLQSCSFMRQLYPIVITSILHILLKMVFGAISGLRLKRRQQAGKMREDLSVIEVAEAYSDKDIKIVRELLGEYFGSLCEAVIAERTESSR